MAELTEDTFKTEYWGSSKVRSYLMSITDYAQGGEPFVPSDAGMSRALHTHVDVIDGSSWVASYDESSETVLLHGSSGSSGELGEAAAGSTAEVRVTIIGR